MNGPTSPDHRRPPSHLLVLIVALALTATACGSSGSVTEIEGEKLFKGTVLAGSAGCITCHSLAPDKDLVGPSMAGIGVRAGTRQPGVTGADYIRKSIVSPDAFVVPGFDPKMPDNWGGLLTGAEIDALVDYLLTVTQ